MKKFSFEDVKPFILPVIASVVALVTGIEEVKAQKRNEELEQKLDALNQRLNEEES